MHFSKKNKGYFVELNDHSVLFARTSAPVAPFVIEDMRECAPNDASELAAIIGQLQPKKGPSGYLHAAVGVYPARRLIRRQTIETKRVRENGYLSEICAQQFRIEQDKYVIALLNATDGLDFENGRAAQKDVIFCGMPIEDANSIQGSLLGSGIYPERIELGSVATLGGVVDWLAHDKSKASTLVLEIGADAVSSFIVTANGVEASRPITQGVDAMVPIVQKELGLKDEESARKLFYSNTFDFTGMGSVLVKRLLKELQSSIGFYEVQTGQSVGQLLCTQLSPKLQWLDGVIASALGITSVRPDFQSWLQAHQITLPENFAAHAQDARWFGLLALMAQYDADHAVLAEEKK